MEAELFRETAYLSTCLVGFTHLGQEQETVVSLNVCMGALQKGTQLIF